MNRRYRYRPAFTLSNALRVSLMVGTCLGCSVGVSWAGPEGGVVSGGSGSIAQSGNVTNINQSSDRLLVDWNSFNVDSGESVRFHQPGANAVAINRIHDGNPSTILGSLSANGQIVLINPNGVVFGSGSQLDIGSLVVSTASPTEENAQDFVAGKTQKLDLSVAGNPNARILNAGNITVKDAGLVGFVAPNVINNGVIIANQGIVQLASGDMATLDLYGDGLVDVAVSPEVQSLLIEQNGWVQADGGKVVISAAAGETIVNSVINMGGVTQAHSIEQKDGKIILTGDNSTINITGRLDVSGRANNQKGGTITATTKHINLKATSTLDASGDAGGGTIKIGGDYQGKGNLKTSDTLTMEAGSTIYNDALTSGNGGTTILWSDDHTYFAGNIFGRGGAQSGDGGFVETSGKADLTSTGSIDLRATSGSAGNWLIDPTNIIIYNRSQGGTDNVNSFTTAYLEAQNANINLTADNYLTLHLTGDTLALGNNYNLTLTATNVNLESWSNGTIITSGTGNINFFAGQEINFAHDIDLIASGTGNISLQANRTILYSGNGDITTAGGTITLNSDRDGNNLGGISIAGGSDLRSNGGAIILGGGANPLIDYATGYSTSAGIILYGVIDAGGTSGGGNITINAKGWQDSSCANNCYGMIFGGTANTSHNGNITFNTISGSSPSTSNGWIHSFRTTATTNVTTVNGNITINAQVVEDRPGSKAFSFPGGTFTTNGIGNILFIDKTGPSFASVGAIETYGANTNISSGGSLTFITDRTGASGSTYNFLNTFYAAGDVIIRPYTAGTTVSVGTGGSLAIEDTLLNRVTYGSTLWLGGYGLTGAENGYWNSSGNLTINTTRSFSKNVNFISGADILSGGASTITLTGTANSTLWATNDINISHDLDITASGNGSITERAGRHIIYSGSGDITTTGGEITLNSDRDATGGGVISLGSGTILTSNGGNITLGGGTNPNTTNALGVDATYVQGIKLSSVTLDARGSNYGGTISLRGQGFANSTSATEATAALGMYVTNTILQTNNAGVISMYGQGGGTGVGFGFGIGFAGSSSIKTENGDIIAYGIFGNGSTYNRGISGSPNYEATGTGNLDITGIGSANGNGVGIDFGSSYLTRSGNIKISGFGGQGGLTNGGGAPIVGNVNTTGKIEIITNKFGFSLIPSFQTTNDIIIRPYGAGTTVGIGSGSGSLSISDAFLNNLTYGGTLWLGGYGLTGAETGYWNSSGNLTLNTTRSFAKNVNFISGADILSGGASTITLTGTANSTLWATNDINISHDLDITASGSGSVTERAGRNIIYSASGDITTTGGAITINSDRDATGGGIISLGSGSAFTSNGGNIVLGGGANPSTISAIGLSGYPAGIVLTGATLDARGGTGGAINMRGTGFDMGTSTSAATAQHGITITGSSTIQTNGTGAISITGISGGTGVGNGRGLYIYSGSNLISAVNGDVTLQGTANGGVSSSYNTGITLAGGSNIQVTGNGNVSITGTGSQIVGTNYNGGIDLGGNISTVNGTITLTAIKGVGANSSSIGNGGSFPILGGNTTTGNITFIADVLGFTNNPTFQTTGDVTIRPYTAGTTVGIGSGTGTLSLSDTFLNNISHGGTLWLGGYGLTGAETSYWNSSGNLTLNTTRSFAKNVNFISGGSILSGGASTITLTGTASSTLWALSDINISHDLDITASGSGSITERAGRHIIYSASGDITTTGGSIILNSDRDATGGGVISLGSGTALTSGGGNIILGGGADPTTTAATGTDSTYVSGISLSTALVDATGTASGGAIIMNGTGWAASTNSGSAINSAHGILLNTGTVQSNFGGTVTLTGIGGGTGSSSNNLGIYIINTSTVSTVNGTLSLTATGGSGSGGSHDALVFSGSGINNRAISSGSGTITVNATSSNGTGTIINNSTSGIFSASGAVNITTNSSNTLGLNNNTGTIGGASATGSITISGNALRNSGTISTAGNGTITLNSSTGISTGVNNSITSVNGAISLTATSGITLSHATAITSTAGNVSLNSAITSSVAQTFSAGGTLTANAISMGANNLTLTADDLVLNGNLSGTGTLTLQPYTTNRLIRVNTGTADGSNFNLSTADLAYLADGWSGINIGRTNGAEITYIGASTWNDPVTFRTPWTTYLDGAVTGTNGVSFAFGGSMWVRDGSVTTQGQNINFNASATFERGGTITTNGGNFTNIGTFRLTPQSLSSVNVNTAGGTISITAATSEVNGSTAGKTLSLNAGSGTIAFGNTVNGGYNLSATAASMTFNGAWGGTTTLGDITLTSTSSISLPSITTTAGKTISITVNGTGNSITTSTIATGTAGNISLTADDVALGGNLSGTGTLTLQPVNTSRVVNINDNTDDGTLFHLNTTELSYFVDGWSMINIGRTNAGTIKIGASNWSDPVTFRSPATTYIDAAVVGTGNASFAFNGINYFRDGSVTTAGQNITFNNALTFERGGTITTVGGNFTVTGQLALNNQSLNPVSISTAGGSLTLGSTFTQLANTAGKSITFNAGSGALSFGSTVNGAYNLTATGGSMTFYGVWGGTTSLGDITLTSTGSISLPSITTAVGKTVSATVTGAGNSITAGALATGAGGNIILTADDLVLGGNLSGTGNLTLQPYSNSRIVRLNNGIGDFNLSSTELGYLTNGWSGIAIGRDTSTGALLAGATSWSDPLTLRSNDNMQIIDALTMTDGASLTFLNGYTNLYSNITTNGGSVTFSANTANAGGGQDAGTFFLQGNITTQGGNVVMKKAPLAGSATIDTRNNGADGTITFSNGLNRSYKTSDSTLVLQAGTGDIVFNSTADGIFGGGLLHLTAAANTISFNGAWGNSDPFGAVSLTSANSLSLPSITASSVFARTTGGTADITIGSGKVLTSSGAGGITLVAGRNFMNQAGSGALVAGGSGRWLVYSTDVTGTTGEQDLAAGFNRYSCSYGAGCASGVSIPSSGNGLIYSYTPTLTVTPTTKNVTYGDAVSGLNGYAYSIAGYLGSDGSADSVIGSLVGATPYSIGNDVGTYALNYDSGSLASALGYGFSYANKANGVNVTARTVTASLTGSVTKIYDGTANAALAVGNYILSNVYGSDAVSLGNITSGTYNDQNVGSGKAVSVSGLFLSGAKAGNYTLASSSISGNIGVVTPKGLTVLATTGQHKTYGQADSAFAYGYTGLVGGDTSASFTGALARAAGDNAGAYAINVGSLAATGNYTISSFVGADYTIDKAAINVTAPTGSRTYGDSNPTYSWADATISGLQYGESGAVLDNLSFTIANSATASANAGTTHAVTLGGFSDDNYTLGSFTGGMLTIAKAPLTITADSKVRVVIMPLPTLTASFTGLRNGDNASVVSGLTLNTSDYSGASVGSYAITAANGTAADYDITYVNGTMTVTPGALPNTITNPILIVQTASGNPVGAPAMTNPSINTQNGTAAAIDHPDNQYPIIQWDKKPNENTLNTDPLVTFSPELKQLLGLDI